ncbi:MAG: hypothetical protein ABEH83_02615 [Halobacterium sp.]
MSNTSNTESVGALAGVERAVGNAWGVVKTVYYANSVSWRALKSGGLLFFGFFLWAGSNVLRSYTGWAVLDYTAAYGFIVLWYGPVHHVVVIPLALKWRRSAGLRQRVGMRLPNAMLAVFLVGVLVLGTFPAGPVIVDFDSAIGSAEGAQVQPDLACLENAAGDSVDCEVRNPSAVDRVVVTSSGEDVRVLDSPPFEFTVDASEVRETMGQKQFTVHLYEADGDLVRQYTHRFADE